MCSEDNVPYDLLKCEPTHPQEDTAPARVESSRHVATVAYIHFAEGCGPLCMVQKNNAETFPENMIHLVVQIVDYDLVCMLVQ